jgi:hypothetical protein
MTVRSYLLFATLLAISVSVVSAQTSLGIAYRYTKITQPGWINISPNSINNHNVIVGSYASPDAPHGFVFSKGQVSTVDYPGADTTELTGVNDGGDIVGFYVPPVTPFELHGFILTAGIFTNVDFPGSTFTQPLGINATGTIVGTYADPAAGFHGFIYSNGSYTTVDAPQLDPTEPPHTLLSGINNTGTIIGEVIEGSSFRGFALSGGSFHFLNAPGTTDNLTSGINNRGDIVGQGFNDCGYIAFSFPTKGIGNLQHFGAPCIRSINDDRFLTGGQGGLNKGAFVATPVLTVAVTSPQNRTNLTNPVHVAALASGQTPVSLMEVWVNRQKVYSVIGGVLDAFIDVPVGTNERFVVKAVDSSGTVAKVVDTITVN